MPSTVYIGVEDGPGRRRLAALAAGVPSDPSEHAAWVASGLAAAELAGAPAWVRDAWREAGAWVVRDGRAGAPAVDAAAFSLFWLRGYSRRDVRRVVGGEERGRVLDVLGGATELGWVAPWLPPARQCRHVEAGGPHEFGEEPPSCAGRGIWDRPVVRVARRRRGFKVASVRAVRLRPMPHPRLPAGRCDRCRPRADEPPPEWWPSMEARRDACRGSVILVESEETGEQFVYQASCGSRACLRCARAHLVRHVGRYVPAFAAPLRPGWRFEMFTAGSLETIGCPSEYREWRAGLAALCRAMRDGAPECGIAPGTWQGGMIVCETTDEAPPEVGRPIRGPGRSYVHAHVLAVRRERYPYGLAHRTLTDAWDACGVPEEDRYTPTGRVRAEAIGAIDGYLRARRPCQVCGRLPCACEERDPCAWLGLRELQRRAGIGEVGHHDVLGDEPPDPEREPGVPRAVRYLQKVTAYTAKVTQAGAQSKMFTDGQVQWTLKGTRRLDPFGCFRGWHAGPTVRGAELRPGERDARRLVGVFSDRAAAEEAGGRPEEDGWPRFEWHRLDASKMAAEWDEWADVPAFLSWLARRERPPAPERPEYVPPEPKPWWWYVPPIIIRETPLPSGGAHFDYIPRAQWLAGLASRDPRPLPAPVVASQEERRTLQTALPWGEAEWVTAWGCLAGPDSEGYGEPRRAGIAQSVEQLIRKRVPSATGPPVGAGRAVAPGCGAFRG